MRKLFVILMSISVVCGCGRFSSSDPSVNITEDEREARIAIDFSRDSNYIVNYLKLYYPELTAEQVAAWEATNALEHKYIDGQKRYFRNAGRNLFRIDKEAKKVYEQVEGVQVDQLHLFLDGYNKEVIKVAREQKKSLVLPVTMTIKYTLTVKPDVVPDSTVLRAWMPYPREDQNSVKDVRLISTSEPEYKISSDKYVHKSIYMEKIAVAGQPTVFSYELSFKGYNEWYDFNPEDIKPYDIDSRLYKKYTAERATHVIFSDRIKKITDSIIGTETNPYIKVKKIYRWIADNYPWASAREYSTVENIPEYVLDNNHGDCGQVGLLLITMARYAGVPARWQSGWMLHPNSVNMHDWLEVYYEGIGWVPTDQSFGRGRYNVKDNDDEYHFYTKGLDAFRWIVNSDYSGQFSPAKKFIRSETVDFQRGEVEWEGGNLYFDKWSGWISDIQYKYEKK
ncbi:MAG: transglutaminase domain-containing protein [Bacteroidales bacterium]|jgi:transglutaminase-like putative cysteine protease|nr:transglutaminase domain-containing protein [Bacteroidales bacterium]HPB89230.1 transglutaminase domain-containing protein [Bacteroidales bacterium]HQN23973.1 transglutaminase domain-containing protein [Bacteroidales bacterium]